ncbi:MAG: hypothetical protein AAF517_19905 [Planctomycetota bacterium]
MRRSPDPIGNRDGAGVLFEVVLSLGLFVGGATVVTAGLNSALDQARELRVEVDAENLAATLFALLEIEHLKLEEVRGRQHHDLRWDLIVHGGSQAHDIDQKRVEIVVTHPETDYRYRLTQTFVVCEPRRVENGRVDPKRVEHVRRIFGTDRAREEGEGQR